MDETYMPGSAMNRRGRPRGDDGKKTCVVGVVGRKSRVMALAANDAAGETLHWNRQRNTRCLNQRCSPMKCPPTLDWTPRAMSIAASIAARACSPLAMCIPTQSTDSGASCSADRGVGH